MLEALLVSPTYTLLGCDFSSSPSRKKSIVIAIGSLSGRRIKLSKLERFDSLKTCGDWLRGQEAGQAIGQTTTPARWLGAFDLPFGLPRELVETLGWPTDWLSCMQHYCALSRAEIRTHFKAFCDARPVGGKFAHRATDIPAGSSSSMKWVNPPVAYMLHAGVPLLLQAGAELPGLHVGSAASTASTASTAHPVSRDAQGQAHRIALEAYPGMLAREVLGRTSYKSDDPKAQTPERLIARKDLITALEHGQTRLGLALKLSHAQRDALVDDASGDSLDAVLCLLQAGWALNCAQKGDVRYGLPADLDPLEGWIVSA